MKASARLLAWYDRHHRDLPWRGCRDPWAVWVSEVMLQQTRVETVVPYFRRFLARFPTPAALAAADVDEALALWSGLGYYRRARQLHAAARAVAADGERVPGTARELERLPGVGPYTAAAIASIAFDEAVPVLDGNVARVLSRRLALAGDPAGGEARRRLLGAASELLDARRPGDGNQALMELGATVCTPRAPGCGGCPLRAGCRAHASGRPEAFPAPRRRPRVERVRQATALVERGGRVLLVRRGTEQPVLPGLWEPPTVDATSRKAAERALAARYGGRWRLGAQRASIRHTVTRRALEIAAYVAEWDEASEVAEGRDADGSEAGWFDAGARAALALTGAARKLLARAAPPG